MSQWSEKTLSELGEFSRGKSKHRPRDAAHLYGGPYPFIQTGDVKAANHKITEHSQTYSEAGLAQSKLWPAGTLCITIAANIAETGILTFPACFPDSVIGFSADPKKSNVDFVEYLLQFFRQRVQKQAIGSVQDNINLGTFQDFKFLVPDLSEQDKIAEVLTSLDEKIELNRKQNCTLEAIAQTLFKHWFVDFEFLDENNNPYKSSGGAMQPSELGEIPAGWKVGRVDDICARIFSGGTPNTKTNEYWDGEIPWLSSGETRQRFILSTEKTITQKGVENSSTRLARKGSTVIASAGQGKTRGQTAYLGLDSYVNQSVVVLEADTKVTTDSFLFCNLSPRYEQLRQLSDSQSIRGSLTTKLLAQISIAIPPIELAKRFDAVASPMIEKAMANAEQSKVLAELRDTLLPKLMSGELRVA